MEENIKVNCPCCDSVLVIRRRDGVILETREALLKESSGDRFKDAFKKVEGRAQAVDQKVAEAKRKEADRMKGAEDFFKQALGRAKESGGERPENPLDFD